MPAPATAEPSEAESTTLFSSAFDTPPAESAPEPVAPPETKQPDAKPSEKAPVESAPAAAKTEPAPAFGIQNPNLAVPDPEKKEPEAFPDNPKGMTGPALARWGTLKKALAAAEKERDETKSNMDTIRREMEEHRKGSIERDTLKKELEAERQRLADIEGEIYVTRVERSPTFRQQVREPQAKVEADMKALAAEYEVNADDILRAIKNPDPKARKAAINELTSDFNVTDQFEVAAAAKTWAEKEAVADSLRQDAGTKLKDIEARTKANQEAEAVRITKDYVSAIDQEWSAFEAAVPELRRGGETAKEWNAFVDSLKRGAQEIAVTDLSVKQVAKYAAAYFATDVLLPSLKHWKTKAQESDKKIAELNEMIKGMRATEPKSGAGGNGDGKIGAPGPKSFLDAFPGERES